MLHSALPLALLALAPTAWPGDPPPLRALFLGDQGHHLPAQRFAELEPVLARSGVALEYTQDLDVLDPQGLAAYDALVVYANIDELGAERERALLDFVAGGGGLVALHCASYCFRDSDAWVELVGAQFERHGTGTFHTEVVDRTHPVTRGFLGFGSWDETYVHTRHNPDRTLLEVRVDEEGREPWTWVRTQGEGRVFYTAWGHDERTWTHPGFQDLVERGLRWASGDEFLPERRALVPFEHDEAEVPLYRPEGGQALERRMQLPLAPQDSREHACVPAGFELTLFAAEPDIGPALCLAFDPRGRLWLGESVDYPNELQPPGQGHDRLRVLEDSDGDGRADRFDVFAEGLSIPTSIAFADGGVIVTSPPDTLLLRDTDDDGRADERRVLFTGWGTGDTHAGPSNLRPGFDGWIWGTVGYSGFEGTVGGVRHAFGQGIFRFRPDGSALEFLVSTSNNTWGLGLSETGEVFCSTANHDQINYLAVPNRFYEGVAGWHGRGMRLIADYERFHPITARVRQVDWHGQYTAAAGSALYTARAFPREWWNARALVCEPTGHLVHASILEPAGSDFVAHDGWNLLASQDEWCAPVAAEVGPDGAVWVIDWYSYIVQHNPTPQGFRTGKGNAYETPLRDKRHARIWRITHRDAPAPERRSLAEAAPTELVAALRDDNLLWRLHAQRLLVERGERDVEPGLRALVLEPRVDAIGSDPGALHALWTLAGLGLLEHAPEAADVLVAALVHPAASVRKTGARLMPREDLGRELLLSARLLEDADALVRREALLALSEMPPASRVGEVVWRALSRPENASDRWIPDAATAAAARHAAGFLAAALRETPATGREAAAPPEPVNLLPNPGFEEAEGDLPVGWRPRTYSGRAEHRLVRKGRGGGWCLEISSEEGSDTSWFADAPVEPGARYELSGWIRTEGLENVGGAFGALFNVHAMPGQVVTDAVTGSSDWTRVALVFDTLERESVSINCLLGGWGRSRGTAWYDDVRLVRLASGADLTALDAVQGQVVEAVTRHYASLGRSEDVLGVLASLESADAGLAGFVLDGLAAEWPLGVAPALDASARAALSGLLAHLPATQKAALLGLADRWERPELFAAERPTVVAALRATLEDWELATSIRLDAAQRWLALDTREGAVRGVCGSIDAIEDPALASGLVRALEGSPSPAVADALIERWPALTPERRREAVSLLLRRPTWAARLLDAIEAGDVPRGDLRAQDWQALKLAQDVTLAGRAARVETEAGGPTSEDRAAVLERLDAAADLPGDPTRGQELFKESCSVCHTLGGQGGEVGPVLDGIGSRDPRELLVAVIDPNRSVEANYRMWVAWTLDGRTLSGRLASESRTAIELLDAEGQRLVVQRDEIEELRAQSISVMPEGLVDTWPPEDVAAVLAWLRVHGQ